MAEENPKNERAREGDAGQQAPPSPATEQQEARDQQQPASAPAGADAASEPQGTPEVLKPEPGVFEIAVLPLQQTTLFPGTVIPLSAGRPRSIAAVEAALSTEEKLLACVTVREGRTSPDGGEATPPDEL